MFYNSKEFVPSTTKHCRVSKRFWKINRIAYLHLMLMKRIHIPPQKIQHYCEQLLSNDTMKQGPNRVLRNFHQALHYLKLESILIAILSVTQKQMISFFKLSYNII